MHVLGRRTVDGGPPQPGFHTFVHRVCMCGTAVDRGGKTSLRRANPRLFSQVRGGFRQLRQVAVEPGTVSGKLTAESRERLDANKPDTCGSTGCPQGILGCAAPLRGRFVRVAGRPRFDPLIGSRVPLFGRTGVDRCRMSAEHHLTALPGGVRRPWMGGASRTGTHTSRRLTRFEINVSFHTRHRRANP
jgi:hypothetical protein